MIIRPTINILKEIKKISDYDIFKYYCSNFKEVGKHFSSPFRKDLTDSAIIFNSVSNRLLFNDFVKPVLNPVQFVSELFGESILESMYRIYEDLSSINETKPIISKSFTYKYKNNKNTSNCTIEVKKRFWNYGDHIYWNKLFGIDKALLYRLDIYPISYYWINKKIFKAKPFHYSYDYYFEDGIFRRKLYNPFGNTFDKWFSNGGKISQGEKLLPKKGDLLIITKSLKDVAVLITLGYTAIAPSNEQSLITPAYINKQLERFTTVILLFDNDSTGIEMSKKHSETFNIPFILIPKETLAKDISDYRSIYGFKATKILMVNLLNKVYDNKNNNT